MSMPIALCFMPEFSNWRGGGGGARWGGVLVQWSMGVSFSLRQKWWRSDSSFCLHVGNSMTKKKQTQWNQTMTREWGGFGVMVSSHEFSTFNNNNKNPLWSKINKYGQLICRQHKKPSKKLHV